MIGKKIGDFEITAEIGKGGMGQVYKARQVSLDRDVAIKILPQSLSDVEEFRERFDVEAKAIASLVHENILQMYSKGVAEGGIHYFAMEYVDGEDLADKLKRGVTFTEKEAIDIAIQVCRGLEAAWRKNIIHRDIKPSNIMVTKNGTVKIADFGLAKSLDATRKLTQTNMYMGTVAYTSPEQGEGRTLDHRTDIYSLGIVLYQLLTGNVPFTAETPSSVIYKHVYEAPPTPRTVNPKISEQAEAVVLKAIAKKPEDRFQNVVEFRESLESVGRPQLAHMQRTTAGAAAASVKEEGRPSSDQLAASAKAGNRAALLIVLGAVLVLFLGGSALYAAKYGYRALLARVIPFAAQEETKLEPVPAPTPATPDAAAPKPEASAPADSGATLYRDAANTPPVTASKERGSAREASAPPATHKEARNIPPDQTKTAKRGPMPAVLVVTEGEANISDIIESVVGRRLKQRSFPVSAMPLNSLNQRQPKADVMVYITVSTMHAAPLQFYGRTMEQYAATISIKAVDPATKQVIGSPRTKTVNYTTLNMQENIEEAAAEMISDLPRKLEAFWKG